MQREVPRGKQKRKICRSRPRHPRHSAPASTRAAIPNPTMFLSLRTRPRCSCHCEQPRCCHCEPVTVSLVWQSVPPSPHPQARTPRHCELSHYCHCEPVTDVTGVAIRVPRPRASNCHSAVIANRCPTSLAWESVSPVPAPAGAAPFFTFASGGHLSFNSERKVRKNATKTYGFGFPRRAMPCAKPALCSSRNRLSRVLLSVKRTVPPQPSAAAAPCHGSRFPLYRRTGVLPTQRSRPR